MNHEHPDVQAVFRKGRGTRDQIVNIRWIIEKAREFQKKNLLLLYWLCPSLFVDHNQLWKILRDENTRPPAFWEIGMQVKKQQSELDMEQKTSSK